jgi:endonuclease YncB( thermonuclease family)
VVLLRWTRPQGEAGGLRAGSRHRRGDPEEAHNKKPRSWPIGAVHIRRVTRPGEARLADEYDAAQERGEFATGHPKSVGDGDTFQATTEQLGLKGGRASQPPLPDKQAERATAMSQVCTPGNASGPD